MKNIGYPNARILICLMLIITCFSVLAEAGVLDCYKPPPREKPASDMELALELHKPLYFLFLQSESLDGYQINRSELYWKFQVSLKSRALDCSLNINDQKIPMAFYVAYTQKSFWKIFWESSPITESNYNPEGFVDVDWQWKSLKIGRIAIEHESNGRDGPSSRSWNHFYWKPSFVVKPNNFELTVSPKIWLMNFAVAQENSDIVDYYGWGELYVSLNFKTFLIEAMGRGGGKSGGLTTEISAMFPLNRIIPKLVSSKRFNLYLQYWNGYGESLLEYKRHTTRFGAGFSIWRY